VYPKLSDLIADLFGINIPLPIQTFGFWVAIAFLLANYFFVKEMKRKEAEGLLFPVKKIVKNHLQHSFTNYAIAAAVGFLVGYKGLFLITHYTLFAQNPQYYLIGTHGELVGGIIGLVVGCFLKYREIIESHKLKAQEETTIHPYQLVGNMTIIAAVAGLLGAKLFHNLENINDFLKDPINSLLSFSGLTMYGGLIVGSAAVVWYAKKNNLAIKHVIDACAPGLMLAYGVGRLGCHLSGDGDWGIPNSAYYYTNVNQAVVAPIEKFYETANNYISFYQQEFSDIKIIHSAYDVPNLYFKVPSFIPTWAVAYNYPHNVISDGIPIPNCVGTNCNVLPVGVFPTSFYEFIVCSILFVILYALRKKIHFAGGLFSVYLIFNGVERFLIEKIRVNTQYQFLGGITQAELIAVILIIIGFTGIWYFKKKNTPA
jgi:prolipoprotein diacylglyceryltransferase